MPAKRSWICCLLAIAVSAAHAAALEVPKLKGRVNDLAGLLAAEQIAALDSKLEGLEKSDSTQVAVLIIPSLEGESLEDYSERVASSWRLGVRGRDNGALLLIAMKERKVRIEVGYGLEATLTDALCRRIIENEIIPSFRQGRFYEGIDAGIGAVIQAVRGVYRASDRGGGTSGGKPDGATLDWILFFLAPLLLILSVVGKWGGAFLGVAGGLYLASSLFGANLAALAAGALIGGIAGFVLGALVRAGGRSSTFGRRGTWPGTFSYGGRSGSFGGGFGGGFTGGGGRFGGGGASGGW